jgi:hypothetical protein
MLLVTVAFRPAELSAQTSQDFNAVGTPYNSSQSGTSIAPTVMAGGPTGANFLRLLGAASTAGTNSIAFDRSNPGAFTQIVADFDFRMTPGTGQGQGMGFALLDVATYTASGAVAGPAEEPNFTGSLGIGFDIFQDLGEINANHVSVHFNGARLTEVDAGTVALAGGQWIHAHVVVVCPGGGNSNVSVTLTPKATGVPVALIKNFAVPGLNPYESRAYFAARTSVTDTADHDLAEVLVQFTDADPTIVGKWGGVLTFPIIPIHSTLLSNGKILCWDRAWNGTDTTPRLIDAATLDVPPGNVSLTVTPNPGVEIFCSGHTFLPDGKVFVAGGHNGGNLFGLDTAFTYDPSTNVWTSLAPMLTGGRWYPSVVRLANGDPIVFSGNMTPPTGRNQTVQVWQSSTGTWKTIGPNWDLQLYPYVHLAPNGQIFHCGPEQGTEYLDTTAGTWTSVGNRVKGFRDYGASILYDTGKILMFGGGNFEPGNAPTASAEVIDLLAPTPTWSLVAPMAYARRQCSSVILPDGTVLVTGGTTFGGPNGSQLLFSNPDGAVLAAELWDPKTQTFRTMAGMARERLYHSETVLLPDGRVLSLGSGHGDIVPDDGFSGEVYSPPYLFQGARPAVTAAPSNKIIYGTVFPVSTPDAASVTVVTLVAATSVTHTNNFNQRILRPSFTIGAGSISVTAPSDPNLCPPGPYLLFLLNGAGVPSIGTMMFFGPNLPPVASTGGNITAEAVNASGATVQFNGTSSTDSDDGIASYQWYEGVTLLASGPTPTVALPLGIHTITLKVTDAGGLSNTTNFTVTIRDTTPPVWQSLTATPQLLRSVTDVLVSVTLTAAVTDAVDPAPTTQVLSVASTEATSGLFPGDLTPDWQITPGSMTLTLRSERYAIIRRYTVTAGATDASGNLSKKSVDVKVRGKWFP